MEGEEETEMVTGGDITITERRRKDEWMRLCSVVSPSV